MRIIFCDTNKLYGLFVRWCQHEPIAHSYLKELSLIHDIYISDTVLDELVTIMWENHWIFANPDIVFWFKQFFGLHIIASKKLESKYLSYVHDHDDAQILQDAVSVQADILLTNNLKDFIIAKIYKDFALQVTNTL